MGALLVDGQTVADLMPGEHQENSPCPQAQTNHSLRKPLKKLRMHGGHRPLKPYHYFNVLPKNVRPGLVGHQRNYADFKLRPR